MENNPSLEIEINQVNYLDISTLNHIRTLRCALGDDTIMLLPLGPIKVNQIVHRYGTVEHNVECNK